MRVRVVPLQPHCFAFGGFEIQMITAMKAACAAVSDVQRLDPWSRDADFDILHVWGFDVAHVSIVNWAKRAGKQIVVSALLPYMTPQVWCRNLLSKAIGPARLRQDILDALDYLVVVNQSQADTAVNLLGVSRERIAIIPNVIEDEFFAISKLPAKSGEKGYILCTGNVCPRKNQLMLVEACQKAKIPLLLVGSVLTGEEAYGRAVEAAISNEPSIIRWVRGLPAGSHELVEAYHGAIGFALISHEEHQPISLLEAAAAGKPLLIAKRAYARQEFYANALLVDPDSVESIASGLRTLVSRPKQYRPEEQILRQCTRENVGQAYSRLYVACSITQAGEKSDRA